MKALKFSISRLLITIVICSFPITSLIQAQILDKGLVATPDSIASHIAMDILENGGNAVDAGVAALFALSVVQPYASGIGGGGLMLIRMNQNQNPVVIDFREQAPKSTDLALFYQDNEIFNIYTKYGYRSICVPGMIAGAEKALSSYGTMTFQQILEPSIDLATGGFFVAENLSNLVISHYDLLESNRATSLIFLPDWLPLKRDELMKREDLAFTYGLLSIHGAKVFYEGEMATDICTELKSKNGLIEFNDFQDYQIKLRQPIKGTYRNLDVLSVPPPSSGGVGVIELLRIIEKFDFKNITLNSGLYIHLVVEAMKQVFDDREKYYIGDPEYDQLNPKRALSNDHIEHCYSQVDTNTVLAIGNRSNSQLSQESSNGSHISVLDKHGNSISISCTINGFFGSAVTIPKYGILLNNAMYNFSPDSSKNNALKSGKRPQTTLAPTILFKDQKPFLIIGGTGAEGILSMLAQIIVNVVDFELPLDQAVRAPRFHYDYYIDTIELETRIEANAIEYLKQLGHKIQLRKDFDVYFGSAQVVLFDPAKNITAAVNDVRQEGVIYIK